MISIFGAIETISENCARPPAKNRNNDEIFISFIVPENLEKSIKLQILPKQEAKYATKNMSQQTVLEFDLC